MEPLQLRAGDGGNAAPWTDARTEQRFVGINVANSPQQLLVQQSALDRRVSAPKEREEAPLVYLKRLHADGVEIALPSNTEAPEAARVHEAELPARSELHDRVGMLDDLSVRFTQQHATRHAKVDDPLGVGTPGRLECSAFRRRRPRRAGSTRHLLQTITFQFEDNVLAHAPHPGDAGVFQSRRDLRRRRLHSLRLRTQPHRLNGIAGHALVQSTRDGFDFGKLGHGEQFIAVGLASSASGRRKILRCRSKPAVLSTTNRPRPTTELPIPPRQCILTCTHPLRSNPSNFETATNPRAESVCDPGDRNIFCTELALKKGKAAVIVGAQWGDEGKGKIVDVLSEGFPVVARYAGGHNAGHTVIINGKKFILQLVPCGVLRSGCCSVIGNGVVLDPTAFLKEVGGLREAGVQVDGNLFVSNRAQVILPYHRMIELAAENAPGRVKIGTTSRGIGPAYEDKMGRRGLRVADLLDLKLLKTHIDNAVREKNMIAHALFNSEPLDSDKMYTEYAAAAEKIAPFVCDTAALLNRALTEGKSIVFEGAQGTMLDIDHGTYPFVTSSSATSGGAATGTGVPPTSIDTVIGITKAYCTRVGSGPFPTELLGLQGGAQGEDLRKRGNEFGAVTGRPRRTGWLDLPLLRYAGMINGISWLVVTKLDVLDHLREIPVCVGYKIDGKETIEVPAQACGYEKIECVYRKMPGWVTPTSDIQTLEGLPKAAREYLTFIEKETGARVGMISTGPDREQTILVPDFVSQLALQPIK